MAAAPTNDPVDTKTAICLGAMTLYPGMASVRSPGRRVNGVDWQFSIERNGDTCDYNIAATFSGCIKSIRLLYHLVAVTCRSNVIGGHRGSVLFATGESGRLIRIMNKHFTQDSTRHDGCSAFHFHLYATSLPTVEIDEQAMRIDMWDKLCNYGNYGRATQAELKEAHEATAAAKKELEKVKAENQQLQDKIKTLEVEQMEAIRDKIEKEEEEEEGGPRRGKKRKVEEEEKKETPFERLMRHRREVDDEMGEFAKSEEMQKKNYTELAVLRDAVYTSQHLGWNSFFDLIAEKRKKEEEDKLKAEALQCRVCLNKPRCVLIQPCMHVAICEDCMVQVQAAAAPQCPICRGRIERTQQVFVS
jgi:hypothetical protein